MTAEEIKAGQVLLVDKPLEWTSFQAVAKIRYTLQKELGLKNSKLAMPVLWILLPLDY